MSLREVYLVSYELNKNDKRGVYQYSRSLVEAISSSFNIGLLTQAYFSKNMLEEIESSLNQPDKYFKERYGIGKFVINFFLNSMGFQDFLNVDNNKEESCGFLRNVDFFLNKPAYFYNNNIRLKYSKNINFLNFKENERNNIIFTTSPLNIKSNTNKIIQTLHDMIPLDESNDYKSIYCNRVRGLLHADIVLAVSNYSKERLLHYFPEMRDRVKVIYQPLPVNEICLAISMRTEIQEMVLAKYGIARKSYIYYVGAVEKRKNTHNLIAAHNLATNSSNDIPLVISGSVDMEYCKKYNLNMFFDKAVKNIIYTGYIDDVEKYVLLRNARALVFPTLSEGFGIPLIEAQSMGTPVIACNNSAVPEVVGTTALLIDDPQSIEELSECIRIIINDNSLVEKFSNLGLVNYERFDKKTFNKNIESLIKSI